MYIYIYIHIYMCVYALKLQPFNFSPSPCMCAGNAGFSFESSRLSECAFSSFFIVVCIQRSWPTVDDLQKKA